MVSLRSKNQEFRGALAMSAQDRGITRGSFLRLFAAAPIAATALAKSSNAGADQAADNDKNHDDEVTLYFQFAGNSYRVSTPQQIALGEVGPYPDRLVMSGTGQIRGKFRTGQTVLDGWVGAYGAFTHYENNLPPGNNIPLQFTGTWTATNFVSFELLGVWGTDSAGNYPLAAGVLVLDVNLVRPPTTLIPLTQVPSVLTLVSNLSPELFSTPPTTMPDGVTLLAPNDPVNGFYFVPIPFVPPVLPGDTSATPEAYTPVVFGTLNETRTNVPPSEQ
jgi:hypothetical protein